MAWFEYEGLTQAGMVVSGKLEAADHAHAMDALSAMRLEVRQVRPAAKPPAPAIKISDDDLIFFNDQLASMVDAKIALDEGLALMARDLESPPLRRWVDALVADMRDGATLEQAVIRHEKHLPVLYSRVIRAGVQSGDLAGVLFQLNQHLRLAKTSRRIVWESISYPLLVFALSLVIISFFFLAIIPQLQDIYSDFAVRLPVVTMALLAAADYFPTVLIVFAAICAASMLTWRFMKLTSTGRHLRNRIILCTPVIRRLHLSSLISRFVRAVSAAVSANVTLPEALRLAASATGSEDLEGEAESLARESEHGRSVFVATQHTRLIPPLFGYCVQAATGRDALPESLNRLAASYEARALHSQAMIRIVLFPMMIILVGGFIAICALATIMPLISLLHAITG